MNKIVFLSLNARFTHTNLAFYYFYQISKQFDCEFELLELSINHPYNRIISEISRVKPDILLFSVYIWNSALVSDILSDIKKLLPNCKIILGGPEVSYNSEEWLNRFPSIDQIITGAGEASLEHLFKENFVATAKTISLSNKAFDKILFPYQDIDLTTIKERYIYYESSRGCPFKCSYCLSSRKDQKLEFLPLERVKMELDYIISFAPRIVKFVDRTFNADKTHARGVWKHLIDKSPQTTFHFEIHPEFLNEEDFELLAMAPKNLFQFEMGIQSLNQQTLLSIHRSNNWHKSKENIIRLIQMGNIHLHLDLIVGLPFDDSKSISRAFNEVHSLNCDHFQLGFLKVLPGTEMKSDEEENLLKYSTIPPYEIFSNKWLNFTEILLFKDIEIWLERLANSGKFKTSLKQIVAKHNSFFEFYTFFLDFIKNNNFSTDSEKWEKNALLLFKYWDSIEADNLFILDCLRWDWCHIANGHYYPEFLTNNKLNLLKKENNSLIKEITKDKGLKPSLVKRGILFEAYSKKFHLLFKDDFDLALFVKEDRINRIIKFSSK